MCPLGVTTVFISQGKLSVPIETEQVGLSAAASRLHEVIANLLLSLPFATLNFP